MESLVENKFVYMLVPSHFEPSRNSLIWFPFQDAFVKCCKLEGVVSSNLDFFIVSGIYRFLCWYARLS